MVWAFTTMSISQQALVVMLIIFITLFTVIFLLKDGVVILGSILFNLNVDSLVEWTLTISATIIVWVLVIVVDSISL